MNESYDSNGQSEYDFTVCLCSIHHEDAKNKSNHSFVKKQTAFHRSEMREGIP